MRSLIAILAILLAACAGSGSAPRTTSLSCEPDTLVVGETTEVTCSVSYEDEDANVDAVAIRFTDPAGMVVRSEVAAVGTTGVARGTIMVSLVLLPSTVGEAQLEVLTTDALGNESNAQSQSFVCVSP